MSTAANQLRTSTDTTYYVYALKKDPITGQTQPMSVYELDVSAPLPEITYVSCDKDILTNIITLTVTTEYASDLDYTINAAVFDTPQVIPVDPIFFSQTYTGNINNVPIIQFTLPTMDTTSYHYVYLRIKNFHDNKSKMYEFVLERTKAPIDMNITAADVTSVTKSQVIFDLLDYTNLRSDVNIVTDIYVSNIDSFTDFDSTLQKTGTKTSTIIHERSLSNPLTDSSYYVFVRNTDVSTGQQTPTFKIHLETPVVESPEINNIDFAVTRDMLSFNCNIVNSLGFDYTFKMKVFDTPQVTTDIDVLFNGATFSYSTLTLPVTPLRYDDKPVAEVIYQPFILTEPHYAYIYIERENGENEIIEKTIQRSSVPRLDLNTTAIDLLSVTSTTLEIKLLEYDTLSTDISIVTDIRISRESVQPNTITFQETLEGQNWNQTGITKLETFTFDRPGGNLITDYYLYLRNTDVITGQTTPVFKMLIDADSISTGDTPIVTNIGFVKSITGLDFSANVENTLGYSYSITVNVYQSPQILESALFNTAHFVTTSTTDQDLSNRFLASNHFAIDTTVPHYAYIYIQRANGVNEFIEKIIPRLDTPRTDLIIYDIDVESVNVANVGCILDLANVSLGNVTYYVSSERITDFDWVVNNLTPEYTTDANLTITHYDVIT